MVGEGLCGGRNIEDYVETAECFIKKSQESEKQGDPEESLQELTNAVGIRYIMFKLGGSKEKAKC